MGYNKLAKFLRLTGATEDRDDEVLDSTTPLYGATKGGHPDIVKLLVFSGANVNADSGPVTSMTVLEHAVLGHHPSIVRFLLRSNATIKSKHPFKLLEDMRSSGIRNCEIIQLLFGNSDISKNKKLSRLVSEEYSDDLKRLFVEAGGILLPEQDRSGWREWLQ